MLPSVFIAASFAVPVEMTFTVTIESIPVQSLFTYGDSAVPPQYAIDVWGDPPHLRNYPWSGGPPSKWKNGQLQSFSSVPTAEKIKLIEKAIALLKDLNHPAVDLERLQHDLDEMKAKSKKSR